MEHLQSTPASVVASYPGIGPGTVQRLQSIGIATLADLVEFGFNFQRIPGIGPVKAFELKTATVHAFANAEAQFDAGASAYGREYQKRCGEMARADHAEREVRQRRNAGIGRALTDLQPLVQLANRVTFFNHLFRKGQVSGLTEAVMALPLPEVVVDPPATTVIPVLKPVAPDIRPVLPLAAKRAGDKPVSQPVVDLFKQALSSTPTTASEHPLLPKLRAYCAFALVVAKADGRIAKSERAVVRELLASTFGHDATLVRFMDPVMEQTEKNVPDEDDALSAILKMTTPDERRMLFAVAERIADAAGERGAREVDALRRIATALQVTISSVVVEPTGDSRPPLGWNPRAVLEIDPTAQLSVELIRRRYLILTERADPAKAAALGPEFAAMAEAKRADLRKAALEMIAPFGEPLDPPAAPPKSSDIRHNPDLDDVFGG